MFFRPIRKKFYLIYLHPPLLPRGQPPPILPIMDTQPRQSSATSAHLAPTALKPKPKPPTIGVPTLRLVTPKRINRYAYPPKPKANAKPKRVNPNRRYQHTRTDPPLTPASLTHRDGGDVTEYKVELQTLYPRPPTEPSVKYNLTEADYDTLTRHLIQTPLPQSISLSGQIVPLIKVKPPSSRSGWVWGAQCLACDAKTAALQFHTRKLIWVCPGCADSSAHNTHPTKPTGRAKFNINDLLDPTHALALPKHDVPAQRLVLLSRRLKALRDADARLLASTSGVSKELAAMADTLDTHTATANDTNSTHATNPEQPAHTPYPIDVSLLKVHNPLNTSHGAVRYRQAIARLAQHPPRIDRESQWPTQHDLDTRQRTYTA